MSIGTTKLQNPDLQLARCPLLPRNRSATISAIDAEQSSSWILPIAVCVEGLATTLLVLKKAGGSFWISMNSAAVSA
jgi:hypothetical protein